VGRDTFNGLVASLRGKLFRDTDFAELYCPDNSRTRVVPSQLARLVQLGIRQARYFGRAQTNQRSDDSCDVDVRVAMLERESRKAARWIVGQILVSFDRRFGDQVTVFDDWWDRPIHRVLVLLNGRPVLHSLQCSTGYGDDAEAPPAFARSFAGRPWRRGGTDAQQGDSQ